MWSDVRSRRRGQQCGQPWASFRCCDRSSSRSWWDAQWLGSWPFWISFAHNDRRSGRCRLGLWFECNRCWKNIALAFGSSYNSPHPKQVSNVFHFHPFLLHINFALGILTSKRCRESQHPRSSICWKAANCQLPYSPLSINFNWVVPWCFQSPQWPPLGALGSRKRPRLRFLLQTWLRWLICGVGGGG